MQYQEFLEKYNRFQQIRKKTKLTYEELDNLHNNIDTMEGYNENERRQYKELFNQIGSTQFRESLDVNKPEDKKIILILDNDRRTALKQQEILAKEKIRLSKTEN